MESRSSSDLFGLLGLEPGFDVDAAALEQAYLERSRVVHPDRFVSAPAAERVAALQQSMQLNLAYQTLRKPVSRAEYLLARGGSGIGDHEKVDVTFLDEVLELREELSLARRAGRLEDVARLEKAMKSRHAGLVAGLAPAFAARDLPRAKELLIELRYVARYLEECDAALDEDAGAA